ncbi:MAG: hypothetical protein HY323_07090 [Betaproteobacteria bacterium]|nr:hypothetical protein [Betaproteobacteria bacterium]
MSEPKRMSDSELMIALYRSPDEEGLAGHIAALEAELAEARAMSARRLTALRDRTIVNTSTLARPNRRGCLTCGSEWEYGKEQHAPPDGDPDGQPCPAALEAEKE